MVRQHWCARLFIALAIGGLCLRPALAASDADNPFGVSSSAQASGRHAEWMPKMAKAGVKWVRICPDWNQVEPAPGVWNWTWMDSMLEAATSNNLQVSGLLLYNAAWLNANTHTFPTNDYQAWARYVSNIVSHAQGHIRNWEIWNEPESFAAGGTPYDYARVVTNAYAAAKAADPNAQLGLSVASVDIVYLEQAIRAGASGHFDFICVHPYETLGSVVEGQEALFMSIVPTIRKMLTNADPAKAKVPIWFTEIGEEVNRTTTPTRQAGDLVKAYAMGISQGVTCLEWFEAHEGGYSMGLLGSGNKSTPAYHAYKNLAFELGAQPKSAGWVLLDETNFGFVFQGATTSVMVAWAPTGNKSCLHFQNPVTTVQPLTGDYSTTNDCELSSAPILILGVPQDILDKAALNVSRPFPWQGDYTESLSVSVSYGQPNREQGLHPAKKDSLAAVEVQGEWARDCSKASSVAFTIDPNFLSYVQAPIQIRTRVRRGTANDAAGFNLKYESNKGWRSIGWNSIPSADKWYTLSWTISDDEFVGKWGHHFSLDSDSTNHSGYYLQDVTVTKLNASRVKKTRP
jgi:hypothetical protein